MVNEPRLSSTFSEVIRGIWKSSIGVLRVVIGVARRAARPLRARTARGKSLLRVQLDDELLLHRSGDLPALRLAQHLRRQPVVVGLQPRGDLAGQLGGVTDGGLGRRAGLDR